MNLTRQTLAGHHRFEVAGEKGHIVENWSLLHEQSGKK
jgi:hypothetical protein